MCKNYFKTSILLFIIGMFIILNGCNINQPLSELETENVPAAELDIYAYIESLGFSTKNTFEEDGMIVVEGDWFKY